MSARYFWPASMHIVTHPPRGGAKHSAAWTVSTMSRACKRISTSWRIYWCVHVSGCLMAGRAVYVHGCEFIQFNTEMARELLLPQPCSLFLTAPAGCFGAALRVFETDYDVTNDLTELVRQCMCSAVSGRKAQRLLGDCLGRFTLFYSRGRIENEPYYARWMLYSLG